MEERCRRYAAPRSPRQRQYPAILTGIMDGTELQPGGPLAHITDLVNKLLGPACAEIGAIFGDSLKVHRTKNFIRVTEKTNRMLEDADLEPNSVPSRVLLPIMDACSAEDDDDLQERWAGLLATASQEGDSFSPSFAETLKQLTPDEAKHFSRLYDRLTRYFKRPPTESDSIPYVELTTVTGGPRGGSETYLRLGLIWREYGADFEKPTLVYGFDSESGPVDGPGMLGDIEEAFKQLKVEVGYKSHLTEYSLRFLKACRGPQKEEETSAEPSESQTPLASKKPPSAS
jgi:hypothetical protein